jgi:hypothetical protein
MTRFGAWMAAALVTAAAGCAAAQARKARALELERQLDAVLYDKPLDEVWQQARVLLAELDYPLAAADAKAVGQREMNWAERLGSPARATSVGAHQPGLIQALGLAGSDKAEGDTQWLDTGWNGNGERYHLEGTKVGGGCRVIFTHVKADRTDRRDERTRDLEMELDLARRVDPEVAARIEASLEALRAREGG